MQILIGKYLNGLQIILVNLLIIIFPIFVWFSFNDNTGLPKLLLLILFISILFLLKALEIVFKSKIEIFKVSKLDFFVFLLAVTYLAASIMSGVNRWEAFFIPGTASLIILLSFLYFFIKFVPVKYIKISLIISSLLLSLSVLLMSAGFFSKITLNLTGNFLGSAFFLLIILPFSIEQIIDSKEMARKAFFGLCGFIIVFGLILSIYKASTKETALVLPDFGTSWQVALDTVKISPLGGVGPGNYLTAFEKLRPVEFNHTPLFNIKFTNSRSGLLTLITETGLAGLFSFGLIVYWIIDEFFVIFKLIGKGWIRDGDLVKRIILFIPLLIATLYLFFFPGFIVPLFVFFILLSVNYSTTHKNIADFSNFGIFKYVFALILVVPVLLFGYKVINPVKAELAFKSSYDSLSARDASKTYNLLIQAVQLNPNIDRYHATFAQVNLALARSVIQKSKNPTDTERKQIAQLVQTAISEGKLTVNTNFGRADNWALLGNIYRSVIPLAQQADQFAIDAYNQAIILDPIDPTLRISLGSIYYGMGKYNQAIDSYRMAAALKPDYANAHYNLALAYKKKGEKDLAKQEFTNTLNLLTKGSSDYNLVQKGLDNIGSDKPSVQSDTLNAPAQTSPELKPRIELPQEATPPATIKP